MQPDFLPKPKKRDTHTARLSITSMSDSQIQLLTKYCAATNHTRSSAIRYILDVMLTHKQATAHIKKKGE